MASATKEQQRRCAEDERESPDFTRRERLFARCRISCRSTRRIQPAEGQSAAKHI
jgi:hypothetical protein